MKKAINLLFILVLFSVLATAQVPPTGEEILRRVDANIGSDNKISTAEMIIHTKRGSLEMKGQRCSNSKINCGCTFPQQTES